MVPLKTPGLDEFAACFYHNHWHIIVDDANQAVLSFLNGNEMNQDENYTYIALILKVLSLKLASDFRPLVYVILFTKLFQKY